MWPVIYPENAEKWQLSPLDYATFQIPDKLSIVKNRIYKKKKFEYPYLYRVRQQQLIFCFLGIIYLFGGIHSVSAQQVEFREEPAIKRLIDMTIQANRDPSHKIDVWRIQISATVDRRQMEAAKATFKRRYSWFNIVNTYSEPYYKLQVGAYHQRSRAEAVLYQLKKDYPGAYLVRDKVRLSELSD